MVEEDDYSRIFYLKLILNNLQSPVLCQLMFKNLFPEKFSDNNEMYLRTLQAIYEQYQNIIREQNIETVQSPLKENNEENDEIINEEEMITKETSVRLKRLNSITSPIEQYESSKALVKEVKEKLKNPNYFEEKLKFICEPDSKIKLHHEKESSLAHYATSSINLAAICEDSKDAIKHHKNMYSYIIPRLIGESNGMRLVTLQLLSTLLKKHNSVATHKLFPCYFYSQDKVNQCQNDSSSIDISSNNIDINLKSVKEDNSLAKIKELKLEYITVFHSIHHFKKLFQMNFNEIGHRLISTIGFDHIKTNELQEGRYLDLFKSLNLSNINSRMFIYPYLLDVGSSIQYNEIIDKAFRSTFSDPLKLPPSNVGEISIDVSQYVKIPKNDESPNSNPITKMDGNINSSDVFKLLDKDRMDDVLSIMKGFQNNQLLQCLLNLVKSWLENSYEINLVLSGVFHQLLTSSDHFFLYQYLIMNDQILPDGDEKCSLYTIIQQHIQKVNDHYNIIKTFPRVHDLYITMYEKVKDIQENIRYRSKSSYITLESAVDISNICNYNGFLENIEGEDPSRNASPEFEALLRSMDAPARQDFLNMFKVPTIKNIIALMEFLKDIIASLHIQFEHFALA
ncbi:hypothetical protein PIROE2DRAFT_4729 [Piromyces sp. E2]|nr:hypothetical protein PIROE2DRAFT_4729 [Piromyces sp. E2]|eukprot:OUM67776.1 hypothetical protein PIROE2DRAFT_4729 [Piromyces sp. E2]